jgi:S-DNA-T family DNA segregation ATPase FtsK/SpoIIIE
VLLIYILETVFYSIFKYYLRGIKKKNYLTRKLNFADNRNMKRNDKIVFTIGIILLALASFFAIGLMMQFLYLGTSTHKLVAVCYATGQLLTSVYGFSSILVPIYLLVGALLSFAPKWTRRKGIYFVSSILPFFTIALVEHLCKFIFAENTPTLRLIGIMTFVLVSALLVAIEYLLIAYFIDQIEDDKIEDDIINNEETADISKKIKPIKMPEVAATPKIIDSLDTIEEELPVAETKSDEIIDNNIVCNTFVSPKLTKIEELEEVDELEPLIQEEKEPDDPIQIDFNQKKEAFTFDELCSEKEAAFLNDPFDEVNKTDKIEEDDCDDDKDCNECTDDRDNSYDEDTIDFDKLDDEEKQNDKTKFTDNEQEDDDLEIIEDEEAYDDIDEDEIEDLDYQTINVESVLPLKAAPESAKQEGYYIPTDLLELYTEGDYWIIDEKSKQAAVALKDTLNEFKIEAEVTGIRKGPVITMFEILPAAGVRLSKIVALADNIALRLAAQSVRIVAPIPGKHAVGIEIPNSERTIVGFREIISADLPQYKKMEIPVVLGKKINGDAQIIDLAKTPHLLIAGATGSGKSVCVNTIILSLLYKKAPSEIRMILIDPKIVELKLYNDIPHLLTPVITEPKKAFQALQYALCEMERRYALLDGMGVRDITNYNKRIKERQIATEKLPYIVIIIDEFADLMATTGKELESTIARLAAMSRAVGIHLVLATQRPSIDVITGLIKANIPSRIAFMVASKTDSRIILDQVGAEKLLGKGDMLYTSATDPFPTRIQGTFVSDDEVESVVDYVKQYGPPDYIDDEIFVDDEDDNDSPLLDDGDDPLYEQAIEIVMQAGKASASYIQRRLKIGYNRAARIVEQMEDQKIVGPPNGSKPREILRPM